MTSSGLCAQLPPQCWVGPGVASPRLTLQSAHQILLVAPPRAKRQTTEHRSGEMGERDEEGGQRVAVALCRERRRGKAGPVPAAAPEDCTTMEERWSGGSGRGHGGARGWGT